MFWTKVAGFLAALGSAVIKAIPLFLSWIAGRRHERAKNRREELRRSRARHQINEWADRADDSELNKWL